MTTESGTTTASNLDWSAPEEPIGYPTALSGIGTYEGMRQQAAEAAATPVPGAYKSRYGAALKNVHDAWNKSATAAFETVAKAENDLRIGWTVDAVRERSTQSLVDAQDRAASALNAAVGTVEALRRDAERATYVPRPAGMSDVREEGAKSDVKMRLANAGQQLTENALGILDEALASGDEATVWLFQSPWIGHYFESVGVDPWDRRELADTIRERTAKYGAVSPEVEAARAFLDGPLPALERVVGGAQQLEEFAGDDRRQRYDRWINNLREVR